MTSVVRDAADDSLSIEGNCRAEPGWVSVLPPVVYVVFDVFRSYVAVNVYSDMVRPRLP